MSKQQSEWLRDLLEPGWREREAAIAQRIVEAIPLRRVDDDAIKAPATHQHTKEAEK